MSLFLISISLPHHSPEGDGHGDGEDGAYDPDDHNHELGSRLGGVALEGEHDRLQGRKVLGKYQTEGLKSSSLKT